MATKKRSDAKNESYFLVTYRDQKDTKVVDLKVKTISDSPLGLSFIMLKDFIFDEASSVVNPVEEGMRKRFENTKSLHLSMYSILSIEEVGLGRSSSQLQFKKAKSNLVVFPSHDFPKN